MKILYHCGHPDLHYMADTGYGRHMRGMVKGFQALGHEVDLFVAGGEKQQQIDRKSTGGTPLKKVLKAVFPSIVWETVKDLSLFRHNEQCYRELKERVRKSPPDLILERVSYMHNAGIRVGREEGIPVFLEVNTPFRQAKELFSGKTLMMGWAERMEKRSLRESNGTFTVSSAIKAHFHQRYRIPEDRMMVLPNAVDWELLKNMEGQREELRGKLGLTDRTVIGFVGSIFPYHGVDTLLEAFFRVSQDHKDVSLLIVGDGQELPSLQEKARKKGQDVIFTGSVEHEEVYAYISAMDITVMPSSNWFGSPVKLFEYGAMGKPIIAPNTAPVRDVIDDGRTGLLIGNGEGALVDLLEHVLRDPTEVRRMGERFQKQVLTEHTWSQNARRALEFIQGKG